MKHVKVFKKVEDFLGVTPQEGYNRKFSVEFEGKLLTWYCERDGEASLYHARNVDDIPDSMTDYFPGHFYHNVTQLLHSVKPPPPKFPAGTLVRGKDNKRAARSGIAGKVGLVHENSKFGGVSIYWGEKPSYIWFSERDLELAV